MAGERKNRTIALFIGCFGKFFISTIFLYSYLDIFVFKLYNIARLKTKWHLQKNQPVNTKIITISFLQCCFLLFTSLTVDAQNEYKRKLSVSEWIEEMVNCKENDYSLMDAEIYYDGKNHPNDNLYISWIKRDSLDSILVSKKLIVNANVHIRNCKFQENLLFFLGFIEFKSSIEFWEFKNLWVVVKKCKFNILEFTHSNFKNGVYFYECEFNDAIFIIKTTSDRIVIKDCQFIPLPNRKENDIYFGVNNSEIKSLSLIKCSIDFGGNIMPSSFKITWSEFNLLKLQNIDFKKTRVNFSSSKIEKTFIVRNCKFISPVGFENFTFPERGMRVDWELLKGNKICLWKRFAKSPYPYTAVSDSQLANSYDFRELLSIYNNLFTIYKTRGDRKSANGCYVEMKDLETRMLKYEYKQEPTFTNLLNYQLNVFLKFFAEYGTSPVRSIKISIYVILIFAFFYFFFYSEWDRINRTFFVEQYRSMLKYFRSNQKLEDFYSEKHKEEFQSYKEFKKELEESKIETPFFINILGRPLYHLSLVRHKIMTWLYRRTEILSGRWVDLKPARKIIVGTTVVLAITIYLIYLGFIRATNSIILSINTFSTLGFGDILVKGFTRYIAILEGFLGWFLLSIFSVSLISQILQN